MNRMIKISIAVLVAAALLGGGALAMVASAQTPPPPAQKPGDVFWSTLANKLNVSEDVLRSAVRDAAKAVVAQAVADGKIKQDAADQLNQRIDKLPLTQAPFPILPQKRAQTLANRLKAQSVQQMLDAAANTLGMNRSDLVQELRDGLTLGQIAQQKGVDPSKLKSAMLAVVTARIDEAVQNGKLTQDKANALKANLDKAVNLDKRFALPGQKPQVSQP